MGVVSDMLPPLRHSLDLGSMLVPHPPAGDVTSSATTLADL